MRKPSLKIHSGELHYQDGSAKSYEYQFFANPDITGLTYINRCCIHACQGVAYHYNFLTLWGILLGALFRPQLSTVTVWHHLFPKHMIIDGSGWRMLHTPIAVYKPRRHSLDCDCLHVL